MITVKKKQKAKNDTINYKDLDINLYLNQLDMTSRIFSEGKGERYLGVVFK